MGTYLGTRRILRLGQRRFRPSDVPQSEADALIRLYNATNGDSWSDNTNWLTDTTVGNWFGVTVSGGHVTQIKLHANNLNGEWTAAMLTPLTQLQVLWAHSTSTVNCSFTLGDLAASMTYLHVASTSSTVTGALSDLPAGMQYMLVHSSNSTITGGAVAMAATEIRQVRIEDCSESQAAVDSILDRIWADRDSFTYATLLANVGGDNDPPTGTVQNTCPPTDPAEKLYNLAHAQCVGDTHETWSITYNGGSEP